MAGVPLLYFIFRCIDKASPGTDYHYVVTSSVTSMADVLSHTVFIFRCIAKASPGTDCHHVVTSSDSGEMFLWDTVDGLCQESLSTLLLATKQLKVLNVCLSETI